MCIVFTILETATPQQRAKPMKFLTFFFTIFYFSTLNAFALNNEEVEIEKNLVKGKLQSQLETTYLKKLEVALGDCGSDSRSCLELIDGTFYRANFKEKEICYPYTMCGFYKCMEEKYQCESAGVDYFTKLAFPTCSQYEKNINEGMFTKKGIEWIYTVMVCLQKGLVEDCQVKGNCPENQSDVKERKKTCDYITEFTLNYHPGCYINSGVGVCRLPLKDKMNIWRTVSRFLTPREREEAYKVVFHCMKPTSYKKSLQ